MNNHIKIYKVDEFNRVIESYDKIHIHGVDVKLKGIRKKYPLFKRDNFKCKGCGVQATHYAIEKRSTWFVIQLYHESVLMTIDHICPKSKGGGNSYKNLQTMCYVCNNKKGSDWDQVSGKQKGIVKANQPKTSRLIERGLSTEEMIKVYNTGKL